TDGPKAGPSDCFLLSASYGFTCIGGLRQTGGTLRTDVDRAPTAGPSTVRLTASHTPGFKSPQRVPHRLLAGFDFGTDGVHRLRIGAEGRQGMSIQLGVCMGF